MRRTKLPPVLTDAPRTVLQDASLAQLRRLLRLRFERGHEMRDVGLRLLDGAIVASIADARAAGVGERARRVVRSFAGRTK